MHKKLLALSVLAALCLLPAFSGWKTTPFPSIQGWTLAVDSMVYTPDNLWNIIDGAADVYLLYGFVDLRIGDYVNPDSIDVRAELYAHSSAANAFGIYSQERKPEYNFIKIGTEGYTEDGVLNFLCGTYYVKLTSHTMGASGRTALRTVAESLASHMRQENTFPPSLALFPPEGKIQRSESYIADSYLGYSFFRSAYVAQYDSAGKTQLFVMEYESPAAAQSALDRYLNKINDSHKKVRDGKYNLSDANNGPVGILLEKQFLCGVVNCAEEKTREAYIQKFEKRIKSTMRRPGRSL